MSRPDVPFWRRVRINLTSSDLDGVMVADIIANGSTLIDNVNDMVDKLKNICNGGLWRTYLYRVHITGHGNRDGQYFGTDWVDTTTLPTFRAKLEELRPHFCAGAVVTLGGCRVGYANSLLQQLSSAFGGVPVRAGTALQRPLIPGMEGSVTQCDETSCTSSGRTVMDSLDDNVLDPP